MSESQFGVWLVVGLAIVGVALAVPLVTAHDEQSTEPGVDTAHPVDGDTTDRGAWINTHMTDHMGPDAVDDMESHMGVTFEDMAREMAPDDRASTEWRSGGHGC